MTISIRKASRSNGSTRLLSILAAEAAKPFRPTARRYSKEGKAVVAAPASEPFKLKLDLFANFAQFIYSDNNLQNGIGPQSDRVDFSRRRHWSDWPARSQTRTRIMIAWQVGARLTFPNNVYFQLAPTLYNYTGDGDSLISTRRRLTPPVERAVDGQNQTGINSLLVFDMPMEVGWKLWDLPMRIFGEFADNIEGDDRAHAAAELGGFEAHTGQHTLG